MLHAILVVALAASQEVPPQVVVVPKDAKVSIERSGSVWRIVAWKVGYADFIGVVGNQKRVMVRLRPGISMGGRVLWMPVVNAFDEKMWTEANGETVGKWSETKALTGKFVERMPESYVLRFSVLGSGKARTWVLFGEKDVRVLDGKWHEVVMVGHGGKVWMGLDGAKLRVNPMPHKADLVAVNYGAGLSGELRLKGVQIAELTVEEVKRLVPEAVQ